MGDSIIKVADKDITLKTEGEVKNLQALKLECGEFVVYANALEIHDESDRRAADDFAVECVNSKKFALQILEPYVTYSNSVHKHFTGQKKSFVDGFDKAHAIAGNKLHEYDKKIEAEQAEEQRKIDAEAEEEQKKQIAEGEATAKVLEAQGETKAAKAVREIALSPVESKTLVIPHVATKTKSKKKWRIVSTDKTKVDMKYLNVDESKVLKAIELSKGTEVIMGITYEEFSKPIQKGSKQ